MCLGTQLSIMKRFDNNAGADACGYRSPLAGDEKLNRRPAVAWEAVRVIERVCMGVATHPGIIKGEVI